MLNGMFAFILYDKKKGVSFIARDHLGIIPLYVGWDNTGTLYVASEMKALDDYCTDIKEFRPGTIWSAKGKISFDGTNLNGQKNPHQGTGSFGVEKSAGEIGERANDVRCSLWCSHFGGIGFFANSSDCIQVPKETS